MKQKISQGDLITAVRSGKADAEIAELVGASRQTIARRRLTLDRAGLLVDQNAAGAEIPDEEVIRRIRNSEPLPDGFDATRRAALGKMAKTEAEAMRLETLAKAADKGNHPWEDTLDIIRYVFKQVNDRMCSRDMTKAELQEQLKRVNDVIITHVNTTYDPP